MVSVEVHVPGKAITSLSDSDDWLGLEDGYESLRLKSSDTVARAKEIIAATQQIPFPDRDLLLEGKTLEDGLSLTEAGVTNGALLVMMVRASEASLASQLEELLRERTGLSPNELSLHYSQRYGTPVSQVLRTLGLHGNLKRFLEERPQYSLVSGCVTLASGPKLVTPPSWEEKSQGEGNPRLAAISEDVSWVC